jgi:hypothetical protein
MAQNEKNGPQCGPTHFLSKLMRNLNRGTSSPKNVGVFFRFQKSAKVNNRPMGENSPILVTLHPFMAKLRQSTPFLVELNNGFRCGFQKRKLNNGYSCCFLRMIKCC